MKVEMLVTLDLPDDTPLIKDYEQESLAQLLFDEYINHVTCSHLETAVKWCARGKVGSENEDLSAKIIYEHHAIWGEICSQAKWDFKVIK